MELVLTSAAVHPAMLPCMQLSAGPGGAAISCVQPGQAAAGSRSRSARGPLRGSGLQRVSSSGARGRGRETGTGTGTGIARGTETGLGMASETGIGTGALLGHPEISGATDLTGTTMPACKTGCTTPHPHPCLSGIFTMPTGLRLVGCAVHNVDINWWDAAPPADGKLAGSCK